MYEAEAKERAYNEIRSQGQYIGSGLAVSQGTSLGGNVAKPVIAQAMLQELQGLLEKARMIDARQTNLKERIFGPYPECPSDDNAKSPSPSGFLHETNAKIQALHMILDRVIQNCVDLERLA